LTPAKIEVITNGKRFLYKPSEDSTDIALQVSTASQEEINLWDKQKIVESLMKEVGAEQELAVEIADEVEKALVNLGQARVTTSFIRELIDLQFVKRGLPLMMEQHTTLGLPTFDVENIIFNANKENSNTTHNPESVNLTIAESVLKQYALQKVFSQDIAQAHYEGRLHLHDLGFIIRPYALFPDAVVRVRKRVRESSKNVIKWEKDIRVDELFELVKNERNNREDIKDVEIYDREDWTGLDDVLCLEPRDVYGMEIELEDGSSIKVTSDHPCLVNKNGKIECKPAGTLEEGEDFIVLKEGIDYVECRICGRRDFELSSHIDRIHGIDKEEYYKRYPEAQLYSEFRKNKADETRVRISLVKGGVGKETLDDNYCIVCGASIPYNKRTCSEICRQTWFNANNPSHRPEVREKTPKTMSKKTYWKNYGVNPELKYDVPFGTGVGEEASWKVSQ
jgi:hypothetical protein